MERERREREAENNFGKENQCMKENILQNIYLLS